MVIAATISHKLNYLSLNDLKKIKQHFKNNKLPVAEEKMYDKKIFEIIQKDKKSIGGKVNFVLIKSIGSSFLSKKLSLEDLKKIVL